MDRSFELCRDKQTVPVLPTSALMELPRDFYFVRPSTGGVTLSHSMDRHQYIVLVILFQTFE